MSRLERLVRTLRREGAGVLSRREALAAGASVFVAACFSDRPDPTEPPQEGDVIVEMTPQLTFDPDPVRISSGQAIVWRNVSSFPHTATGDASEARDGSNVVLPEGAEPWNSGVLTGGQEFRRVFTVPGQYRYFCIPHEQQDMVGRIIVEP